MKLYCVLFHTSVLITTISYLFIPYPIVYLHFYTSNMGFTNDNEKSENRAFLSLVHYSSS